VTKEFYASTSMGADFDRNPVLGVQGAQLQLLDSSHPSGAQIRVLDLGCGAGTPSKVLMQDTNRYSVVGADLSESALSAYVEATGRSGVQLDAQRLPFADGSFDVVVSDDVVEHLVDTDSYAHEIRRVLVPGGWLFLSTPNLAAWFNRLALLAGMQPAFTEVSFEKVFGRHGSDIVGHLRIFTSKSIQQFLEHHGFDCVDVRGARFDALPRSLAKVDAAFARMPSLAGNTVIAARRR
jgi:2-polyprenyl-3-methyl-5-hydroxy-6-metoxy-1,4-benzoquinol methylase